MESRYRLFANGTELDTSPEALAFYSPANEDLGDVGALRERLDTDGYLYIKNFFDPGARACVRRALLEQAYARNPKLNENGKAGIANFKEVKDSGRNPLVRGLAHSGKLPEFFTGLLGGEAMAFDYIWSRVIGPGCCETPHCDTVYMNRGTSKLYTAWIPLADVPLKQGPLMMLERSHHMQQLDAYRALDVDSDRNRRRLVYKHGKVFRGMHYSKNPRKVQEESGRRWLASDFSDGDIIIFSVHMLHGTLDNRSDSIRVTVDARFQLASDPVDDRYVGEFPQGHKVQRDILPHSVASSIRRVTRSLKKRV